MRTAVRPTLTRLVIWVTGAFLLLIAMGAILARARLVSDFRTEGGEGAGGSAGNSVEGIRYGLESSDPTHIESITFTLTPASGSQAPLQVMLSGDGGARWMVCTPLRGSGWTCPIHVPLRDLTSLRVVAAQ